MGTDDLIEVTRLLKAASASESEGITALFESVYDELRRLAGMAFERESSGHTLQPTALVHEAWMRLERVQGIDWQDRRHFFRVAARAMRRILVEHVRTRQRLKRGGAAQRIELTEEAALVTNGGEADVLAIDGALEKLEALSERQARIVELRFFADLPVEDVANVLDVSKRTVEREWRFARAWLAKELGEV